jgi:hypothetical protein
MSDFLLNKDSIIIDLSADSSIDVSGHALVVDAWAGHVYTKKEFSVANTTFPHYGINNIRKSRIHVIFVIYLGWDHRLKHRYF